MASINSIQSNIDNRKPVLPYRDAKGAISTKNNVKPLKPDGHLVHDSIVTVPKYFIQDIAYDMKAIKDGFRGNANDHQLGRLNDVGLKVGGIGIATMLAARTSNPLARIMEYVGLGAFLTSMALYPKLAINLPSRLVHGFDIGKEYIDEQGRKKSVFQDSNYIPFDMYQADYPGEDLDVIGDRLGIPKDVKNRHDIIKEQMRKIAIQNNTLWMTTAAVVPVMTGLMCYGLERGIANGLESFRNAKFNSINKFNNNSIANLLHKTESMPIELSQIPENSLSKDVNKFLVNYKNKELPKVEFDHLVKLISKNLDSITTEGLEQDLTKMFLNESQGEKSYVINDKFKNDIIISIKKDIPSNKRVTLEKVFVPSEEEVKNIISKFETNTATDNQVESLKAEFRKLFDSKIAGESVESKAFLNAYKTEVLEKISKELKKSSSRFVSESSINDVTNLAKIIGEFKDNQKALEKAKIFKIEHVQGSVVANTYAKFEKTLIDVLDIKYKDLKSIKESEKFAQEIFESKLNELVKDDAKYKKAIEKLTKVVSEMEVKLNGSIEDRTALKDLISGIENNYNNTAKRISSIGKFQNTVDRLVKEDVNTLSNTIENKQDLFDFLDGIKQSKYAGIDNGAYFAMDHAGRVDYAKYNSKGVGSSKNLEISRIVERYQGAKNSFNRILHMFDVYKRPLPNGEYDKKILEIGKEVLMSANSSDHMLKLNTHNNPNFYKTLMSKIWDGNLEQSTKDAMSVSSDINNGDVLGRLQKYIGRFKNIIANNDIDFTKPNHKIDEASVRQYMKSERSRIAKFNLVAQTPIDFLKKAAETKYGNQKWLRVVSTAFASVCGTVLLAQFTFGKLRNPQNMQRLVNHDSDK